MARLTVIKVGGKIVEEPESLAALLDEFARVEGLKLLVHGGGRSATRIAEQLGLPQTMVAGRRVTDAETLRVVTMVYGGLVNKQIVASLQARGINALGLTGADMDIIRSHRRAPKRVVMPDGGEQVVDYGYVGDVDAVDASLLAQLMRQGVVPVVAPLTHDGWGSMLNTNADTMAGEVARALAGEFEVVLMYCFEKRGVLRDAALPDTPDNVIASITADELSALVAQGIVADGMLPKLENAFAAIRGGVSRVVITRADAIADQGAGTVLLP